MTCGGSPTCRGSPYFRISLSVTDKVGRLGDRKSDWGGGGVRGGVVGGGGGREPRPDPLQGPFKKAEDSSRWFHNALQG